MDRRSSRTGIRIPGGSGGKHGKGQRRGGPLGPPGVVEFRFLKWNYIIPCIAVNLRCSSISSSISSGLHPGPDDPITPAAFIGKGVCEVGLDGTLRLPALQVQVPDRSLMKCAEHAHGFG